jgi:hypothetical protein
MEQCPFCQNTRRVPGKTVILLIMRFISTSPMLLYRQVGLLLAWYRRRMIQKAGHGVLQSLSCWHVADVSDDKRCTVRCRFMIGKSRRLFLKTAVASGAPVFVLRRHSAKVKTLNQRIDLQLYTVTNRMDTDPISPLKQLAAFGCKGAESPLGKPSPADLSKALDDLRPKPARHYPPLFSRLAQKAEATKFGTQTKNPGLQLGYHSRIFRPKQCHSSFSEFIRLTESVLDRLGIDCGWMTIARHNPACLMKRPPRYRVVHTNAFCKGFSTGTSLLERSLGAPILTELGRGRVSDSALAPANKAQIHSLFATQDPPFVALPALGATGVDCECLKNLQV